MASTNKTTHYELSQYVGSDKPTYLTDYNNDMSAIDTGIYNAQTKADSAYTAAGEADTKAGNAQTTANTAVTNAGTANTNIGTMANLNTTEKSNLVGAVNEVNNRLNFTSFKQYTGASADKTIDQGNIVGMNMNIAKTYNGDYAKVYGQIILNTDTSYQTTSKVTLLNTGLTIASEFTVVANGIIVKRLTNEDRVTYITRCDVTFKTNGNIEIPSGLNLETGNEYNIIIHPSIIQLKSFGDQP